MAIWIMLTRLLIHVTCNFLCYFTCVSERNVQVVLIQIFVNCCHMNSFLFYYIPITHSLIQNLQSPAHLSKICNQWNSLPRYLWRHDYLTYSRDITCEIQKNNTKKTLKMISCRLIPKVSPYTLSKFTQMFTWAMAFYSASTKTSWLRYKKNKKIH